MKGWKKRKFIHTWLSAFNITHRNKSFALSRKMKNKWLFGNAFLLTVKNFHVQYKVIWWYLLMLLFSSWKINCSSEENIVFFCISILYAFKASNVKYTYAFYNLKHSNNTTMSLHELNMANTFDTYIASWFQIYSRFGFQGMPIWLILSRC